jgi:2'-5' RNA ligase
MAESSLAPVRRRLFFALWPDDATRQAIVRATRRAVRACGGKPTPRENLHVTLAFLGPINAEDLARIEAFEPPPRAPFELTLDQLGFWAQARVLWLGPTEAPAALRALERELWDRLVALGFERERKPYAPHVTLARKARGVSADVEAVVWPVGAIALVESKTGPRNSRYTALRSWPFADG